MVSCWLSSISPQHTIVQFVFEVRAFFVGFLCDCRGVYFHYVHNIHYFGYEFPTKNVCSRSSRLKNNLSRFLVVSAQERHMSAVSAFGHCP